MIKPVLFLLFILFSVHVSAQIEGRILNTSTSEGIENVTIQNNKSEIVAISNNEGIFTIPSSESQNNPFTFSRIGYISKTINFDSELNSETIYLTENFNDLGEVVLKSPLIPARIREIPAAVTLLSENDFKQVDQNNFISVLNHAPGVYVNQGALNTTKISIRGIGARSQYSTNRIQAYFNGIPLTSAEGELTLDDFDTEALSAIEIIKGPNSSLYGAGLGGVINMYAKIPEEGIRAEVGSNFGSYNLFRNFSRVSYANEKFSILGNFVSHESDGYRDNGEYSRQSGVISGIYKPSEKNTLNFLVNLTRLKAYIPSSLNYNDFINKPASASFTWKASRGYESYDKGIFGISYSHNFSNRFKNTSSIFLNFRNGYEPRPFDILEEEQIASGVRTQFNLKLDILKIPSELSFGVQYFNEHYKTRNFENLYEDFEESREGVIIANNKQVRDFVNIFSQLNLQLTPKLLAEIGMNINSTGYSLTDLYKQDSIDQFGDYRFKTIASPRLAVSYKISEAGNIYANISHGFSTPTVAETLTPDGLINTEILPETGINYEIGYKGNWLKNRMYTEISLFSIQIDNLLVAKRISEDQYVGINAGKTDHNGAEIFLKYYESINDNWTLMPYVNAAFNYFLFDEFIDDNQDFSGNKLPGIPRQTINAGLELIYRDKFNLNTSFYHAGEIQLNDENSMETNSYSLVNIKTNYLFSLNDNWNFNFSAGINNVFNEKYASSILPNAVGFGGAAPRYYYPGNPRNYYVGIRFSINN